MPPRAFNLADFLVKTISDPHFAAIPSTDEPIEHRPPLINYCQQLTTMKPTANRSDDYATKIAGRSQRPLHLRRPCWLSQVGILLRRSALESRRSMREFLYKLTTFVVSCAR